MNRLAGLLERKKVESSLIDGDSAYDHCVLRLSSVRRPGVVAFLEYENIGWEPRLVGLVFREDTFLVKSREKLIDWDRSLELRGSRNDDPDKIAQWVEHEYLNTDNG